MFSNSAARAAMIFCAGVLTLGTAAAQSKVAIINVQRAIIETADIKKAQAELEAKYRPRTQELESTQKQLQDIQAQLQNPKTTQEAANDLQFKGKRLQREYQRLSEDLQGEVDRERNQILQKASQRMTDVVKKIAEGQNLDVVIDVSNTVYFKPALEITDTAIKAYDVANPVK